MLDMLGSRQQDLLTLLLETKAGLTVDELAKGLAITRNAVRQHLAALEKAGVVVASETRPSGGRPQQLYVLSDKGFELFPRQYALLAKLLVEAAVQEGGSAGLAQRMKNMGLAAGKQLLAEQPLMKAPAERAHKLITLMKQLGYGAKEVPSAGKTTTIEADNCVFHSLARQHPEICQFDLALMSSFAGRPVDHQTCMARGDNVCRFKLGVEDDTDTAV